MQVEGELSDTSGAMPVPLDVSGWASSDAPIVAVMISVDGVERAALYGLPRLDVVHGLGDPTARYSGFFCALTREHLEPGRREIGVRATDANGYSIRWQRDVEVRPWPSEEVQSAASTSPTPDPSPARRRGQLDRAGDLYTRLRAEFAAADAQDLEADLRLERALIRLHEAGLAPPPPGSADRRRGRRGERRLFAAIVKRALAAAPARPR